MNKEREQFGSRLGFILMTAGCAIGLGNIWRFPVVTGACGGGFFVLLYAVFLIFLGFPVMMMELSLGRGGRSTYPGAFRNLSTGKSRFKWHTPAYILFAGNFILLMYYTVISGWLLAYAAALCSGKAAALTPDYFDRFIADTPGQILYTFLMILATVVICLGSLKGTIEKSIKVMMAGLFLLLGILVIKALTLPKAMEGVKFFLYPSFENFAGKNFLETVHAAMAQAFFTLSLGIGSIAICGSYFGKERSLPGEGLWIVLFDTLVAVCAGLIIFPCCFAFDVSPAAGPPLIFITLPKVFCNMTGGAFWGSLFFVFLTVAAFSTLVAVFENLVAFGMDEFHLSRKKSAGICGVLLTVFSLPCILGFSIWKNVQLLGKGSSILDFEDFIVSDNLLPLGALYLALFCMNRYGWGSENFYAELNAGTGLKFPRCMRFYLKWILPVVIFAIWAVGLYKKFL
ncbi:MAG: sodium-dependent transporter [Lentisphaeria bacterium]|nr:sodium-dependent transporter [Lentisphaeria bacterium]